MTDHLYGQLTDAGKRLARIPRFGRLIGQMDRWQLDRLQNKASTFWEIYAFVNPNDSNRTGLLDSGLDRGSQFLGTVGVDPHNPLDRRIDRLGRNAARANNPDYRRWQRTLAMGMLGAVAFEMYVMGNGNDQPVDRVDGDLSRFLLRVRERIVRCGLYRDQNGIPLLDSEAASLNNIANFDWKRITNLNAQGLQHLTLSNLVDEGNNVGQQILFADISTQAFFAAYWAVRWADKKDLKKTCGWIYDSWDDRGQRYAEFWEIAIQLREVEPWTTDSEIPFRKKRWKSLVAPLYDISKQTEPQTPRRATEWIYKTWNRMEGTKAQNAFRSEFGRFVANGDEVAQSIVDDPDTGRTHFVQLADPSNQRDKMDTGQFTIGAPSNENPEWDTVVKGGKQDNPPHRVQLTPFRIHPFCITNQQYERFAPHHFQMRKFTDGDLDVAWHPVVNVNWYDAWCFANWISEIEIESVRYKVTIPTETQWEYACRCGESMPFTWHDRKNGGRVRSGDANFDSEVGWPPGESSNKNVINLERTIRVDGVDSELRVLPNPWGLFQMHGNVWEWCLDWYAPNQIDGDQNTIVKDPTGPAEGSKRTLRGGSWFDPGWNLRSGYRGRYRPAIQSRDDGIRLAAIAVIADD